MKSRSYVVGSFMLFISGIVLLVLSYFVSPNSIWRSILMLPFIIGSVMYTFCAKCPHCGKMGLKVHPFANDCGHCSRCGKLVEYDD